MNSSIPHPLNAILVYERVQPPLSSRKAFTPIQKLSNLSASFSLHCLLHTKSCFVTFGFAKSSFAISAAIATISSVGSSSDTLACSLTAPSKLQMSTNYLSLNVIAHLWLSSHYFHNCSPLHL